MIFKRPENITLTQMAQWADANQFPVTEEDRNKQVEYLYHLIITKAKQMSLFTDNETFDDFALFGVSKLLMRFKNTNESPVKSVVNYIKNSIQYWQAEYIRAFCCGSADLEHSDFDVTDFADYLVDMSSENDYRLLSYDCTNVTVTLRKYLKKIPRKIASPEWSNICVSCFLTLEHRIKSAINMAADLGVSEITPLVSRLIRGLKNRPPILFHLDETMEGYINVLVNELTHVLAVELSHSWGSTVTAEDCLKNLVMAAQNEEDM